MKLRSAILLLAAAFLSTTIYAQNFTADFTEKADNMFSNVTNGVRLRSGWLTVKREFDKSKWYQEVSLVSLLLQDDKMQTLKTVDVPIKFNKFLWIKGLYRSGGKTVLLYAYKEERKDEEYHIAATKINEADLSLSAEIDLGKYACTKGNTTPYFTFKYNTDSTKYFLFNEAVQKGKDNKQFYFKLLNNDLSVLNEKAITMEIEARYVVINSKYFDEAGNVYISYRTYAKEREWDPYLDEDGKIPEYTTSIVQYTRDGRSNNVNIGLGTNFVHTAKFFPDKSGALHIVGTYKAGNSKSPVKGIFICTYNTAKNEISNLKSPEVPAEMLALLSKDGIASEDSKNPGISSNFKTCNFSQRDNGYFDLTLEYDLAFIRKVRSANNVVDQESYERHVGSILNATFDDNGKVIFTRIPKWQEAGAFSVNMSNFSFYFGNKMIFLYNDDKDNLDRDITKKPDNITNFRQSVLMAAIVDEKGNVERKIVYSSNDDKYAFVIEATSFIKDNTYFVKKSKTGSVLDIEHTKSGLLKITP